MIASPQGANAYSNFRNRLVYIKRNFWSGFLFGIGLAAFIDEVVFHHLLQWHHFYDRSTLSAALVSDGLFHAFGWFATVASLFLFASLRRRNALWPKRWAGAVLFGAGIFQLYDGIVQHKLLKLHQIRYNVDILPYDIVWNAIAAAMIIAGTILLLQTRREIWNKKKDEKLNSKPDYRK